MSNLTEHAKVELEMTGWFDRDGMYDGMIGDAVLELIEVFSKQGHSGMSASIVRGIFGKLSAFKPLSPLTGEDKEWAEVSSGLWQNKRCSRVFKDKDAAWDIEGKVFEDPDGTHWTNGESHVVITFPYSPKTEIVKRGVEVKP